MKIIKKMLQRLAEFVLFPIRFLQSTTVHWYRYTYKWKHVSFNFMSRSLQHHKAKHTALANGKYV